MKTVLTSSSVNSRPAFFFIIDAVKHIEKWDELLVPKVPEIPFGFL